MKKFLRRVELEKKRVLLEEIPKQSATAIKRKEKFKALKLKRKLKKSGNLDSLDEVSTPPFPHRLLTYFLIFYLSSRRWLSLAREKMVISVLQIIKTAGQSLFTKNIFPLVKLLMHHRI